MHIYFFLSINLIVSNKDNFTIPGAFAIFPTIYAGVSADFAVSAFTDLLSLLRNICSYGMCLRSTVHYFNSCLSLCIALFDFNFAFAFNLFIQVLLFFK